MIRPARRSLASTLHWPLIAVVAAIGLLGCYNLHSAAASGHVGLWKSQLGWLGLGSVLVAVSLCFDYRITEMAAYPLYAVVVGLLLAVHVAGRTVMGARRWLALGPFTFQPSELTKIAIIFCLARYFSTRSVPAGFALRDLLRPLSPTRPLMVTVFILWHWQRPWLVDPFGELCRGVAQRLAQTPVHVEPLMWFRVGLLLCIFASTALGLWWIARLERASQLLHPWPPKRRTQWMAMTLFAAAVATATIIVLWHQPFLVDPLAVSLATLASLGAPEGPFAQPSPTLWPRALLLALGLGYGALCGWALLARREPWPEAWLAPVDLLAVPAVLVLIQPDLGTAGIIFLIGMSIVLITGVRLRSLGIMGLMGLLISLVAWQGVLKDYQKRRILTFIDPEQDVRGAGWNAVQSLIAVGSGRWLGKGHRNGTQTQLSFLPEQHTDFAFSVWAEEQGFLGCALLVGLYIALALLALRIAAQARDNYGLLVSTGATALIVWQASINMGMVTGSLPVVGITLPLFSYGGSSAFVVLVAVGLLLNVHARRRA